MFSRFAPAQPGSRSRVAWAVCMLAPLVGCTEPRFARDDKDSGLELEAGSSDAPEDAAVDAGREPRACEPAECTDAGNGLDGGADDPTVAPSGGEAGATLPTDAGLDPVRAQWVGRYAARSFLFSFDNPVRASGRYLTLVEISPTTDGGLAMSEELCRFESTFTLIITDNLLLDFPAGVRLDATLSFDAEHFSSELASAYLGYGPAPDDCAAGRTSRVSEGRPWLSNGTCDCPTSNAVPTSARDCRVIDSDNDSQPGNTFQLTLGSTPGVYLVAQEQRMRLVNGYRVEDRLYAQREYVDLTRVLSCTISGRPARVEDCPLGVVGPCPAMFNPVEMVRIEPHQGCAEIREREHGWFVKPKPDYPAGCPAQVTR